MAQSEAETQALARAHMEFFGAFPSLFCCGSNHTWGKMALDSGRQQLPTYLQWNFREEAGILAGSSSRGCLGVEDRKVRAIKGTLMECFPHLTSWRCTLQPCQTRFSLHQQYSCIPSCMDGALRTPWKHLCLMLGMISDKSCPSFKICLKTPTQYCP